MKRTIIFSAFILVFAGVSAAQLPSVSAYTMVIDPRPTGDIEVFKASFPAADNRQFLIFEAVLPASSEAACFASRDFSSAQPVSPDRASVVYDAATSSYNVRWTNVRESRGRCRVLLATGDGDVDTADLAVWRAAYGNTQSLFVDEPNGRDSPVSAERTSIKPVGSSYVLSHQPPNRRATEGSRINLRRNK